MKIYFAPMEGVTDHIYRRIHRRYFPGVNKYFTPFISPTQNHVFAPRELRQISPENNVGVPLTVQFLTKNAEDFLWAAGVAADMGYTEVNLNLGCPSGTVTAKGKGAALLADHDALRRLLDGIFARVSVRVSVKTRLGMREPEAFFPVLDIFNDYPLSELIIHPRTRAEMYDGSVHLDIFQTAVQSSRVPVCYNGDILTEADITALRRRFPRADLMIGRGLAGDPGLVSRVCGGAVEAAALRRFFEELGQAYCEAFGGPYSALHRMKAIWEYVLRRSENGAAYRKKLLKIRRWEDYTVLAGEMLNTLKAAPAPERSRFEEEY